MNFNRLAKCLDDQLGKTKWICGDDITIADIAIASPMPVPCTDTRFPSHVPV